ncbi:MAG TPA: hypothetical protein VMR45_00905 [Patescibacteria group bacterium]|nr:hypothetical protein [Patescibacteria group bacterium]
MSRTFHHGKRNNERGLRVRAVKRAKPDLKRLSRTLIALAEAELEKEAREQKRKKARRAKQ